MKPKILRQMVELTDGFDWEIEETGTEIVGCPDGGIISIFEMETERANFPLLIRRAVDGWNRKSSDMDAIKPNKWCVAHCGDKGEWYVAHKPTEILTVEEVCLLKALEAVLE